MDCVCFSCHVFSFGVCCRDSQDAPSTWGAEANDAVALVASVYDVVLLSFRRSVAFGSDGNRVRYNVFD